VGGVQGRHSSARPRVRGTWHGPSGKMPAPVKRSQAKQGFRVSSRCTHPRRWRRSLLCAIRCHVSCPTCVAFGTGFDCFWHGGLTALVAPRMYVCCRGFAVAATKLPCLYPLPRISREPLEDVNRLESTTCR